MLLLLLVFMLLLFSCCITQRVVDMNNNVIAFQTWRCNVCRSMCENFLYCFFCDWQLHNWQCVVVLLFTTVNHPPAIIRGRSGMTKYNISIL